MANPPDNDPNKKPDPKERNLAAPATTKPVDAKKDQTASGNTSKPAAGPAVSDNTRPLSTDNLAGKATKATDKAGDKLTDTATRISAAGTTAASGAAAAASKGVTTAKSAVTGAAADAKSAASNTASQLRDSANTMGQSTNLTGRPATPPPPLPDRKPEPPTNAATSNTQRPAGIDRPSAEAPKTTAVPAKTERPAVRSPAERTVSRPADASTRTERPGLPTRGSGQTRLARSSLERPPGLDRPKALERPTGLEQPTRRSIERPRNQERQGVPPADRRPAPATRPTNRAPDPRPSDRPIGDRPRRPGPDSDRPQQERPPAHFRDDPRPGRRMAPPPGASKRGRFVGRPPERVAAPINPAYSEEGGAWGPLLFGLLLLLGVGWYAIKHYTPQIQDDLLRRSDSALDNLGLAGQTDLSIDGRNIIMTGNVSTEAERDAAQEAVEATFGVRAVDNQLVIGDAPAATSTGDDTGHDRPSLNLKQAGESVTLSGTVSDQKFATALQAAAVEQYGEANVSGEIMIDTNVTNPGWLSAVTQLMPEMGGVEQPGLAIANGTMILTGQTDNADTKQALGDKATELLKGHLAVDNQIEAPEAAPEPAPEPAPAPEPTVEPAPEPEPAPAPRVLPAFASVTESGDQVTLSGFMSEESASAIAAAYEASGKTVANNISINELAESPEWVGNFNEALAKLENVQDGKLTVARSGNVTLKGVVDSDAAKQAVGEEIGTLFGEDHKVINDIAVELPPVVPTMTPFASVIDTEDQISLSGLLPRDAAKALLKSYRGGDKTVVDNIAIDERVMTPAWTDQLAESLDSVIYIGNPRINITSGGELIVRGIAQSDEASTAAGETLGDLFGDSVSLRNDITVEKPTIVEPPRPDIRELLAEINVAGIRFRTNSAELNGESVAILEQVADVLSQYQDTAIEISGHTDSLGSQEYNLALSADRATTVMQFLETRGIASDRMIAKGYGPARPIATNDNAAGRAQNRRIEFTLTGE